MVYPAFSSADRPLAARLEKAEAANTLEIARLAAELLPGTMFCSTAGGAAVFAGVESPMTRALGVGMDGRVPEAEMEKLESFYREQNSPCVIELCPLADDSVIAFVQNRPYRMTEFNNVLVRRIMQDEVFPKHPSLRLTRPEEKLQWSRTINEGFAEQMPVSDSQVRLMATMCRYAQCWIVEESEPIGGAAMSVQNQVALFFGDAVAAKSRRQGWQSALISERLAGAQEAGCDLAVVSVVPGSNSHRNYERAGFQLIYTRVCLLREFT